MERSLARFGFVFGFAGPNQLIPKRLREWDSEAEAGYENSHSSIVVAVDSNRTSNATLGIQVGNL